MEVIRAERAATFMSAQARNIRRRAGAPLSRTALGADAERAQLCPGIPTFPW